MILSYSLSDQALNAIIMTQSIDVRPAPIAGNRRARNHAIHWLLLSSPEDEPNIITPNMMVMPMIIKVNMTPKLVVTNLKNSCIVIITFQLDFET